MKNNTTLERCGRRIYFIVALIAMVFFVIITPGALFATDGDLFGPLTASEEPAALETPAPAPEPAATPVDEATEEAMASEGATSEPAPEPAKPISAAGYSLLAIIALAVVVFGLSWIPKSAWRVLRIVATIAAPAVFVVFGFVHWHWPYSILVAIGGGAVGFFVHLLWTKFHKPARRP